MSIGKIVWWLSCWKAEVEVLNDGRLIRVDLENGIEGSKQAWFGFVR